MAAETGLEASAEANWRMGSKLVAAVSYSRKGFVESIAQMWSCFAAK